MRIIKYLYSELKKILTWHLYPKPDDLVLKSFFEFLFYLIITATCVLVFYLWNKVPERNIAISVGQRNHRTYISGDSVSSVKARIDLIIPMTKKKYNDQKLFKAKLKAEERFIKYVFTKYYYELDTTYLDSNSSLLYNNIIYANNLDLWKEFEKRYSNLKTKKTLYFGVAHNRGPNSVDEGIDYLYNTDDQNPNDTLHHFVKIEAPSDNAYIKNIYAKDTLCFNRSVLLGGDVLGVPTWYRFEDISQSYYNILLKSEGLDSLVLKINFIGVIDLSNIYPEPDIKEMSSIEYNKPEKIKEIELFGLQFHAKFKELENLQTIRLVGITSVLGGLLLIFFGFMFVGFYYLGRFGKKHKVFISILVLIILLLLFKLFNII